MGREDDLSAAFRVRVASLIRSGACVRRAARVTRQPLLAVLRYVEGQADLLAMAARNGPLPGRNGPFAGTPEDAAFCTSLREAEVSLDSCRALWSALLMQQVQLSQGVGANTFASRDNVNRDRVIREAREWLAGRDCAMICDWLELDIDWFREEAARGFLRCNSAKLRDRAIVRKRSPGRPNALARIAAE